MTTTAGVKFKKHFRDFGLRGGCGVTIIGRHVYGSAYDCDKHLLRDEVFLRDLLARAAIDSGATLIDVVSWVIGGSKGGVSVVAVVTESHLAIHTWPEYGYATIDVYTCGDKADPEKAFKIIVKALKCKEFKYEVIDRSYKEY